MQRYELEASEAAMSTMYSVVVFIACPLVGAVCALLLVRRLALPPN